MEADETLGPGATIAAVLFANITHPEWKKDFPCEYYTLFKILYASLFYFRTSTYFLFLDYQAHGIMPNLQLNQWHTLILGLLIGTFCIIRNSFSFIMLCGYTKSIIIQSSIFDVWF